MSKALLIKGSDFSTNKCGTVHYLVTVPCESISLSETELSLNTLDSQTLTATVSPADTTDAVEWSTSNTDVVTVDNGVLTIEGLGTATVTATCGEQSATCSVTVDNIEIATGWEWGTAYLNNIDNNYGTGAVPENYKKIYYADEVPLDTARLRLSRGTFTGDYNLAPTLLPSGVKQVHFVSNNVSGTYNVLLYDSTLQSISKCATVLGKNRQSAPSSGVVDEIFTVPDGADSITVGLTFKTQYTSTDNPDDVAATNGTKIYLMAGQE